MKQSREKAGKIAYDLMQKPLETSCPREQGNAMLTKGSYEREVLNTIEAGKKAIQGDFFIEVAQSKKWNIIRRRIFYRTSCPTPTFDQVAYQYTKHDDQLSLLWTIPDEYHAHQLREKAAVTDPELWQLVKYVIDYFDGTLLNLCKKLNKEDELLAHVLLRENKE